jgi:DnaK suppressor protein
MKGVFNKKFIDVQRSYLLQLKTELLNSIRTKSNEDIHVPNDQIIEDGDQAQTYINQNVTFGLRERELTKLKEIESALQRIESGSYGICEETDEPIETKRLQKMPWTRYSIQAAEEREREQKFKVS